MKNLLTKYVLIILFFWLIHIIAYTQILIPETKNPAKQQILLSMGLEPEWVTTTGFRQRVNNSKNNSNFYLGGGLKFAPSIVSKGAKRFNFTQALDLHNSQNWKGMMTNDIYLAHNKNRAGTMTGLGFNLRGAMLHGSKNWSKGFEVGCQYTSFTHIRHSAETKDTFDERYSSNRSSKEPISGWYGGTASRLRLGFVAGRKLSDHLALQFGIGSLLSVQKVRCHTEFCSWADTIVF